MEMLQDMTIEEYLKIAQKYISPKRMEHSLGVCYTAQALAMNNAVYLPDAKLAGLFHDIAKGMTDQELLSFCLKKHIPVTGAEEKLPFLLHGKAGAWIAQYEFDILNPTILNAIRWHTTGRENMSPLEKIIYIADYIEPSRKNIPDLLSIRHYAFAQSLDETVYVIAQAILTYLEESGSEIDRMSVLTRDFYRERAGH